MLVQTLMANDAFVLINLVIVEYLRVVVVRIPMHGLMLLKREVFADVVPEGEMEGG